MTKQGRATHSNVASTKVEPVSRAVPPAYPADLGIMKGNHSEKGTVNVTKVPMYEGRGLKAPMVGTTAHKSGSQGRH